MLKRVLSIFLAILLLTTCMTGLVSIASAQEETAKDSKELQILKDLMQEEAGEEVSTDGNCLSDLSLLMAYCSENSFNYGVPVGSSCGGGPHQPDEHIACDDYLKYAKKLGLLLLRM